MELSSPKKLNKILFIKLFRAVNKTPLGETGSLSNFYYLLAAQASSVTRSVRIHLVPYHSLCSTCVTYGMPCHAIGHQVLPTQQLPREAEDFPRGEG